MVYIAHFCPSRGVSNLAQNKQPRRVIVTGGCFRSLAPARTRQVSFPGRHFGDPHNDRRRSNMLWTIFVVLLILWLLGFSLHIAGGLIHLLLVVALVVLVINLMSGRGV